MNSEKERAAAPFLLRATLLGVCLALAAFPVPAAETPDPAPILPQDTARDARVPTFEQALSYPPGDRLTSPENALAYLRSLERASDRLVVRPYGTTPEGRTLAVAVIAAPDRIAALDAVQAAARRLADPRGLTPAQAQEAASRQPVIVWIAAGVHGNESSSTEAVLALAYHLASARDPAVEAMLRDVVVLLDPAQNPDGRARFVQSLAEAGGPAARTDSNAADHDEPWPSGRFNHSLFDLNRDWFFQTQPETRARVAAYLSWMPQVYVDLHEMSHESTY